MSRKDLLYIHPDAAALARAVCSHTLVSDLMNGYDLGRIEHVRGMNMSSGVSTRKAQLVWGIDLMELDAEKRELPVWVMLDIPKADLFPAIFVNFYAMKGKGVWKAEYQPDKPDEPGERPDPSVVEQMLALAKRWRFDLKARTVSRDKALEILMDVAVLYLRIR